MSVQTFLEQTLTNRLSRMRGDAQWGSYQVRFRDLRPLKLNASAFTPFLWRAGPGPGDASEWHRVIEDMVAYSREKSDSPIKVFLSDSTCPLSVMDRDELQRHSIAIIDKVGVQSFLAGRDVNEKYAALGRALARNVGVTALSPYIPGKPASGGRFFGRERLLGQIVAGGAIRNCTIVGNRRIGKTSLLHEVHDRLSEVYRPGSSIFFANLYGAKLKSTWDAVYLVCDELHLNVPKRYTKLGAISERYVKRFPQLLHRFARERQAAVVIFIDEFDSFLEIDSKNDYEFLHLLREAAMAEENCYVMIAGFRRLMETRVRQDSPLYNFTSEIPVTPLTRHETLEMVNMPLERLGIEIDGTNLPAVIYHETRGQPELIQMYCRAVIELYEKNSTIPKDNDLLSYVHKNPAFNRTILHTFLKNTNPYEQLICLHLIQNAIVEDAVNHFEFTATNVEEIRAKLDLPLSNAQSATLLNNLVVGSIIERITGAPGKYRFAVPQLLKFCRDLNIYSLIAAAEAEARRLPPTVQTLNLDTPDLEEGAAASGGG